MDIVGPIGASSERLLSAATERLKEIRGELDLLEEKEVQLDRERAALQSERDALHAVLRRYGETPPDEGRAEPTRRARIDSSGDPADQVVALLKQAGQPMHYREIEKELRAAGVNTGRGKDPATAFLAKYYDDQRLYRPARGTYGLREWVPDAKSVGTRRKQRRKK